MTADQPEKIRQAIAKRNLKFTIFSSFFAGVIILGYVWYKHGIHGITNVAGIVIGFFIVGPLITWLLRKIDWTR
ncbi:MAG TPA: hypothetical protein VFP71_09680 [Candidatus Angelobacter sp.]|nr:hypothetical protein [Candidatus Angelobacter sp.]